MPSRQVRKVDLAEELAALNARFTRLESFTPAAISGNVGGLGFSNTNINMTGPQSLGPSGASWTSFTTAPFDWGFTLLRPTPLLFIATIGLFFGAGGTSTFVTVRCAFTSTFGGAATNDINGNPAVTGIVGEDPATANALGTGAMVMTPTMAAGSYHVQAQYIYQGASAVFTVAGNVGPTPSMVGSLFALSG
jgi:hypothetical protein